MFKRTKVCVGVLAALGGSLLTGTQAFAQTAERVEVTGSRLKSFEVETASPIVTLGAESIKVEATRNVEGLLNQLPQVFADFGGTVSNGATGTATVNLRNLGSQRTLVLIDGKRVPAGSPRFLAADLNQIPVPLIKRIEVLTGGASAVYGSDAVAGVVNFIMNDRFEGVAVEMNHQFYNHSQKGDIDYALDARGFKKPGSITSDGEVDDFSVTLGSNFANNKGNAVIFFGYKKEQPLLQSERDFSACSLNLAGSRFSCGGSSTSYPGRFILADGSSSTVADSSGGVRNFSTATDIYNFGPLNYFQRPSDRYTMASFAHYDINEMARAYLTTSFHDDHTVAQIAPSGLFGVPVTVKYDNPLLSAAWRTKLDAVNASLTDENDVPLGLTFNKSGDTADMTILRRNVEGGGRQDDIRHTSFRALTGVKGDIGPWSYDLFIQGSKVVYQETYKNDFSITRSTRALDVVTDPATGNPVCASALDGTDTACVPYNIWSLGGVTPEALAYLQTPGFQKGFTSTQVVGLNGSVDLGAYGVKLPTAQSGMGLAFGIENRLEKMDLSVDQAFETGDLAGQGGPTLGTGGAYSVRDVFAELRLPLMEKQPGAELLNLSASYRNSAYSTNVTTKPWGVGLEYAPVKEAKLRLSAQRAVRAANITELYTPAGLGLYNNDRDPCAGDPADPDPDLRPTATLAQCQNTGVTAGQYGNIVENTAGQYNAVFGGNAKLNPETANSITLGVVLQPIRDLNITLDYFSVKIDDTISALSPTITLQQCLDTGNPFFCSKVHRNSQGSLWLPGSFIEATNFNIGKLSTSGLDVGTDYRMKIEGSGQVDFSLLGTLLRKIEVEPIKGLGSYDCAGLYGANCGTPAPKWRHKLRTTWTTPWDFSLAATWRYFGKVDVDTTSDNPLLTGAVAEVNRTLKAVNYIDVSGAYNVNKNVTLRMTINNLFDKDPPLAGSTAGAPFGNGNTYPVVYDALGRRISLNLSATF